MQEEVFTFSVQEPWTIVLVDHLIWIYLDNATVAAYIKIQTCLHPRQADFPRQKSLDPGGGTLYVNLLGSRFNKKTGQVIPTMLEARTSTSCKVYPHARNRRFFVG